MNRSINSYKKLLLFTKRIKDDFLKNVPTFDNQLTFSKFNELCYQKMYQEIISKDKIKTTIELYNEIPGLKDINNKARKFYLQPRNKSIKGLDVQLGKKFEEAFIDYLKSENINVVRADTKNKRLPDIMVLDKTKNISSYIELKYHNAPFMLSWRLINREPYEGSITLDTNKIKKQIIEIDSELERPVFFVHWVDFPDLKGVFFNTNEQIKHYLLEESIQFNRKKRKGDFKEKDNNKMLSKVGYTEKFYPPLHEMGDFNELLTKLKN